MEGKDIRKIRKEILRWSMEKFAREVGVSFGTVYNLESGRFKPSYLTMEKIEIFLGELRKRLHEQSSNEDQDIEILAPEIRKKEMVWAI